MQATQPGSGWQDGLMPTHVALLRGINVGGGGRLAMADLRKLVTSLGHVDVTTYIQTGNVVFTPVVSTPVVSTPVVSTPVVSTPVVSTPVVSTPAGGDSTALASELRTAIVGSLGLDPAVIVLTRNELADAIERNPYKDEPNPRFVHLVFLPAELDEAAQNQIRQAVDEARSRGSKDEATLLHRTLYVHTPDGFGTSELAETLLAKRKSPVASGTARNWNTVTKLLELCDR
jgi:uncharacterized protein (DUF1697 family)